MNRNQQFSVNERIFTSRLSDGPLDRWECLCREFLSCDFSEFLDIDPWLQTARPSVRGMQVLVPLLRRVLDYQSQMPVDMREWVGLYRQLVEAVLAYFDQWSGNGRFGGASRHPQEHGLKLVGS